MIIQRSFAPTIRSNPPTPPPPSEPTEDSGTSRLLRAAGTIAYETVEAGVYCLAGLGNVADAMRFGAIFKSGSTAFEVGNCVYKKDPSDYVGIGMGTVGGAALGVVYGAAKGYGIMTLAQSFGGGFGGALAVGATLGVGRALANELFN